MIALVDHIPVLETERLILRGPRLADFDAVAAFYADPRSKPVGGPMKRDQAWSEFAANAGQWLLRGYGFWEIEHRETGQTIGRAGIYHSDNWPEPELGWMLYGNGQEGRGIAQEAATAARNAAARLFGITRPISSIETGNHRSIRLAERMGARPDGDWQTPYGLMLRFRHEVVA
ncbi:MAG: GNAT family N-acetyltransferase [Paracoccus sp. (in: a-proteobacteria)]|uniref:GNAT family N-acetyltransferase n=1 Tax=Paracoccus sp. TaxID=267 RepID=UPI0026E0D56D|nr:GNAT family N-acetyltransferase [Paracoccus sp. (in: a-proteobacteria)]MDO5630660.1 GNAT family N-acetyltransferase [Paracoccus sp. (in: a-proteobacteria)]